MKNELTLKFNNSIRQSKAEKFKYQYDGLALQSSYFVGCKLKFLSLTTNGELSSSTKLVQFENDSIREMFTFLEVYDEEDRGGRNYDKRTDSIFVFNFKNNIKTVFFKNKFVEERKISKNSSEEFAYLYRVEKFTEENYQCD